MSSDMTVSCDNGLINIRVGAIIMKDGKILMVDIYKVINFCCPLFVFTFYKFLSNLNRTLYFQIQVFM